MIYSLSRFPFTVAFLLAIATMIAIEIGSDRDLLSFILAGVVGAVSCAAGQMAYERFFSGLPARIALMVPGCVLAVVHYLLIWQLPEYSPEIGVRTAVLVFALFIAFIWLPVIKSKVSFNESFMVSFKYIFEAVFFAAVIMGGCSAIIAAIDQLIIPVDENLYAHTANIVFVLFAPIFFLSLIPVYPGKKDQQIEATAVAANEELIVQKAYVPKFLEVLLSYIVIPLASVFTVILLAYILLNIRSDFWTDNLLEPMLISYSVTVIMVTILVSRFENKFALWFRRIFPKVLIPIVLFQLASSLLVLRDTGITFDRYYVLLYGIFALCSGIALSFLSVRKNGIIAVLLIFFSTISLIPPIDAFTVSRNNQIQLLESTLIQNEMLVDNEILPKDSISDADKAKITSSIHYLSDTRNLDRLSWLPTDFDVYTDFYSTFGFQEYDIPDKIYRSIDLYLPTGASIPITGYDYIAQGYLPWPDEPKSDYINTL